MRITYNLNQPTKEKALKELAPRHYCRAYAEDCGGININFKRRIR